MYPILTVIVIAGLYYVEEYIDTINEEYPKIGHSKNKQTYTEFDATFLPLSSTGIIIEHTYFTLSYSETHEQAEWVAYELSEDHLSKNNYKRPYFVEDRKVKSKSADWKSYKRSGYDKGHLCPAGDRRFSYEAFHETFLTSNISPQNHDFNSGVWNKLEQKVRFWAKKYQGVYVVTGGVLEDGLPKIGHEGVSVPKTFYKIVIDRTDDHYKAISFLIPNQPTSNSYYDYVVTIDEIEAQTGIDFFALIPDNIEQSLESGIDLKPWVNY